MARIYQALTVYQANMAPIYQALTVYQAWCLTDSAVIIKCLVWTTLSKKKAL